MSLYIFIIITLKCKAVVIPWTASFWKCFAIYVDTDITKYRSWIYEVCNRETCERKQVSDISATNVFSDYVSQNIIVLHLSYLVYVPDMKRKTTTLTQTIETSVVSRFPIGYTSCTKQFFVVRFGQWFPCLHWIPRFITKWTRTLQPYPEPNEDILHPRNLYLWSTLILSLDTTKEISVG